MENLSELRGLKMDELRMVGIELPWKKGLLRQLEPLKLKRLVLNTDDYPKATLAELRKTMTVVDAKK